MERSAFHDNAAWFRRAVSLVPNGLRRTTDRVEAGLIAMVFLAALFAIPVAATVGNAIHDQAAATAARAVATRHTVQAVLDEDAILVVSGPDAISTNAFAHAHWLGPDGRAQGDRVPVEIGATAGSEVTLWVDTVGRLSSAPPTEEQVVGSAIASAVTLLLIAECGCALLVVLIHELTLVHARRAWQREWERVEPRWTRPRP